MCMRRGTFRVYMHENTTERGSDGLNMIHARHAESQIIASFMHFHIFMAFKRLAACDGDF